MAKTIYVKTSDTCNLHCDHCFTSGRHGGKIKWDVEKTIDWIESFAAQYPPDEEYLIIFHGGEPFLAPMDDLERLLNAFCDRPNFAFTINSNFVIKLDERKLAFLKRLDSIGTSWDLDMRFETEVQYNRFKYNLALLRDEGLTYGIMITVNQPLIEMEVDAFLDEIDTLKPNNIRLERLTLDGNAERNPFIFPDNEDQDNWFVKVYKRYVQRRDQLSFEIVTLEIIEQKLKAQVVKTDTNCRNCEQNLVTMNADGSLSGCPNSAGSKKHTTIETGVETFMTSEGRLNEITHELSFNENCLTCDVFHLCGGDCHKLPWQGDRCGGLKNLLRYIKHGSDQHIPLIAVEV